APLPAHLSRAASKPSGGTWEAASRQRLAVFHLPRPRVDRAAPRRSRCQVPTIVVCMTDLTSDVAALTEQLMHIESTSGVEGRAMQFLATTLEASGWLVTRIPVSPGRDVVYARAAGCVWHLTLSTHIDIVLTF